LSEYRKIQVIEEKLPVAKGLLPGKQGKRYRKQYMLEKPDCHNSATCFLIIDFYPAATLHNHVSRYGNSRNCTSFINTILTSANSTMVGTWCLTGTCNTTDDLLNNYK
jgi:hypothetical protein